MNRLDQTIGWSYFACWSLSFYPQIVSNHTRRSVVGLSFDFAVTNLLGFACYSVYCCALAWNDNVRISYSSYFDSGPQVTIQDVCFALHAFGCCSIVCAQCLFLDRHHQQRVSRNVGRGVALILSVTIAYALLTAATPSSSWLGWLYWLSMVKLVATLFKYVPQAYLNYTRKSTVGWAVGNVLLDFSGGVLSLAQTLLNGYRFGWTGVYANPIKFALGFVSIAYDVFFLFQHYVLYPLREEAKDHEEPLVMVPEETDAAGDDEEDALPERKLV